MSGHCGSISVITMCKVIGLIVCVSVCVSVCQSSTFLAVIANQAILGFIFALGVMRLQVYLTCEATTLFCITTRNSNLNISNLALLDSVNNFSNTYC